METAAAQRERFAMLTNRCHRMVRFLHEVALSQADQVTRVEDNPLALWLAELPGGLSLFEHATAGEVVLEAPAAAVLPSPPPLPDALAGWVVLPEPGDLPSDSPPLRETSLRAPDQLRWSGGEPGGWPDGVWPDAIPLRPGGQPVTDGFAEPVRLVDRPEVPAAYQDWLPTWQIWASRARADADRRTLHGTLHSVAGRLAQEGDGLELVLATGLLSWRAPDGRTLRRHLLTTRLAVEIDPVSSAIRLRVPAGVATRLEDGPLLDGLAVFHEERTNALHERLRARPAAPLGADDERLLRDWLAVALDVGHDGYHPSWQPSGPPTDRPRIDLAPAIVLRARGQAALLTYYEQMLDALRGDGRPPLGLVQLVETLEADERLAWLAAEGAASPGRLSDDPLFPLPANPEQAHVVARLRHDSGVVVEGPPGTGKTHTIANLVSALLAEGQRVLVTSQKAQALRVLRDKLPESLRRLCVSLTDAEGLGTDELTVSVSALAAEKAAYDPAGQARRIDTARARRDAAVARRDELAAAIQLQRAAEAIGHPASEVAPGWSGTRGAIAARVRREQDDHGWLPSPVPRGDARLRAGGAPGEARPNGRDAGAGEVPPDAPPAPPLSAAEATELWTLLRTADSSFPDPGTTPEPGDLTGDDLGLGPMSLPSVEAIERLVDRERATAAEAAAATRSATGSAVRAVAAALGVLDTAGLDRLTAAVGTVTRTLEGARRTARHAPWLPRALDAALVGRDAAVWTKVTSAGSALDAATEALATLGLRAVSLPADVTAAAAAGVVPADPTATPAARLLATGEALRGHLDEGGNLRRMFRSRAQKDAADLLEGTTVDGLAPTTAELLDLVLARLRAEVAIDAAARAWALAGVMVGFEPRGAVDEPAGDAAAPEARLARLIEAQDALGAIVAVVTARDRARSLLAALEAETTPSSARSEADRLAVGSGLVDLSSTDALHDLVDAAAIARLRLAAAQAQADLDQLRAEVLSAAERPGFPAELRQVAASLATRDPAAYGAARHRLLDAAAARRASTRRADLLSRLTAAHPALAELLVAEAGGPDPATSASDADWRRRLARFEAAWSWGLAAGWLADAGAAGPGRTGDAPDFDAQLDAAEDAVAAATAQLAGAKAWQHCLERMGTRESAALRAYADAVGAGSRSGRHAERYRQAAREAMAVAQTAVPAWVMPIGAVLSTIPAVRDSFDVVIVDEGSQAGLDSLFLLWLAPRVIIVGDDRQCTPPVTLGRGAVVADSSGSGPERTAEAGALAAPDAWAPDDADELDPVFRRLDALLPDLPAWLRVSFTPRSSLFSLLRTRFGEVIRLREHFRCMPEIIEWSSAMFYRDAPLVPLRQFGADRLPPLRSRHVPHGYTTGAGAGLRNPAEAEALVAHLLECAADPRYDGASFGVVVLQGTGQAELVRALLAARLPAAEQLRRRLRVGTPPDFQGDERDVVFLSMVVAPGAPAIALTRQEYQRRFNVAASRARDQVWLFHSAGLEDLDPGDLRHSYLSYVLAHSHADENEAEEPPRLDQVAPDIPHPRFDSLFEQRVFRELTSAGYRVAPQVEVNGRRIDLVVAGGRARLAVECDGDAVETTARVAHDFARERQLRRAGWPFWRVRQSDFETDPAAALASLWPRLAAAGITPVDKSAPAREDGTTAAGSGASSPVATAPTAGWRPIALSDQDGLDDDLD
ncbi:AAA domain-containing protein [Pseudofrankia sp. DC12]|uniref:AAA domain-containing protein n=1 Tax=Pseudofrankia sp. DC12 TaxID=683315 RepID=UPI0005F87F70|nr:AAA domain-containing protein [Pseudofrankia sp. DC12]